MRIGPPRNILFDTYFNVTNGCPGLTAAAGTAQSGFNRCSTFKNQGSPAANNFRYFSVQSPGCLASLVNYNYTERFRARLFRLRCVDIDGEAIRSFIK